MVHKPKLYDPNHWHGRAQEMRAIAEGIKDAFSKATLLEIADEYEVLASRAAARLKAK
jgi:hypothetical protein